MKNLPSCGTRGLTMAEKEYIEREAVIELAKSNKAVCSCLADIVDVMQIVNDIPTADVQSVKHGEWIANVTQPTKHWSCSECRGLVEVSHYCNECYYDFCPNCGAKNGRR